MDIIVNSTNISILHNIHMLRQKESPVSNICRLAFHITSPDSNRTFKHGTWPRMTYSILLWSMGPLTKMPYLTKWEWERAGWLWSLSWTRQGISLSSNINSCFIFFTIFSELSHEHQSKLSHANSVILEIHPAAFIGKNKRNESLLQEMMLGRIDASVIVNDGVSSLMSSAWFAVNSSKWCSVWKAITKR